MRSKRQLQNSLRRTISRAATLAPMIVVVLALILIFTQPALAQNFQVIWNFTGGQDGAAPTAGLTLDRAGNLYGTASYGGNRAGPCWENGCGTVFKLTHKNSDWVLTPLYSFAAGNDGAEPTSRVVFGPDGSLYGSTSSGGNGFGTIFNLRPAATVCKTALCPWTETPLYQFAGGSDSADPGQGDLVFDRAGNLYGTTMEGGPGCNGFGCGTVFVLTPAHGGWTESVLYRFAGGSDGANPNAGVILDSAGNLYGTTMEGGLGYGTVYQLKPSASGWTEQVLYSFTAGNDGYDPMGGLIFDGLGNLYGTALSGGAGGGGTAFELTPSEGSWNFILLYNFGGMAYPKSSLMMDAAGNLYGTTFHGGSGRGLCPPGGPGCGTVYRLTPSPSGWNYTELHSFDVNDGAAPSGGVVMDTKGNLYGTAASGGGNGFGVVWEIEP